MALSHQPSLSLKKVFITGCAGFIGFHLARHYLKIGVEVIGLDNCNAYYDVSLKRARLALLKEFSHFHFYENDLCDSNALSNIFQSHAFDCVFHLAAQAGVRHSIDHPKDYIQTNIVGFFNLIEQCRHHKIKHLIFASSSSVYGLNDNTPFDAHESACHPVSLYAATKKSNEMMAHSYAHLYAIPVTGLRFFTVYGPWGRPDMAYSLFTKAILDNQPISVFNKGLLERDFTYIDDVIHGIEKIAYLIPRGDPNFDPKDPDPARSSAPYALYNIGNHKPHSVNELIQTIEDALEKKAICHYENMQPGDVKRTLANIDHLKEMTGFAPSTSLKKGITQFVTWYKSYHKI